MIQSFRSATDISRDGKADLAETGGAHELRGEVTSRDRPVEESTLALLERFAREDREKARKAPTKGRSR